MIEISIEKVDISAVLSLQELAIKTFSETFSDENSDENMKQYIKKSLALEQLESELSNAKSEFYFAKYNLEIIGYVKINFEEAQTEMFDIEAIELERIYVMRSFLSKKVGQQLFEFVKKIAVQSQKKYVWLGVWEHNLKAIDFYKKNGFEVFDSHVFTLGNENQTDLMMKLELN